MKVWTLHLLPAPIGHSTHPARGLVAIPVARLTRKEVVLDTASLLAATLLVALMVIDRLAR